MNNNSNLNKEQAYENEYIYQSIVAFVMEMFLNIFGKEIMFAEKLNIYNDPKSSCPMIFIDTSPIEIRTCITDIDNWVEIIFQLSHELTHFAIMQKNPNRYEYISWLEETICEAIDRKSVV